MQPQLLKCCSSSSSLGRLVFKGAHCPSTPGACISAHNSREGLQKKQHSQFISGLQNFNFTHCRRLFLYHHWHFPNEALWFHPPCPSASSVPSCNSYRHTYPPLTPWIPLPGPITHMEGVFGGSHPHAIAPVLSQGIAVCKPKNLCNPVKQLLVWLNVSNWPQNDPS